MWGLPTVSYHPGNSDGHRYCESADISSLNSSRDHVIKKLPEFEGVAPQLQVTTLPNLVIIGVVEEQI